MLLLKRPDNLIATIDNGKQIDGLQLMKFYQWESPETSKEAFD
jgi:hypothetical protein